MSTSFPEDRLVGVGQVGWGSNAVFQTASFAKSKATNFNPTVVFPLAAGGVQVNQPSCNGQWVIPSSWPTVVTQQALLIQNSAFPNGPYFVSFGGVTYQFYKSGNTTSFSVCNSDVVVPNYNPNSILAQAGAHNGIMTMPMAGSSPVFRTTGLGQAAAPSQASSGTSNTALYIGAGVVGLSLLGFLYYSSKKHPAAREYGY